MEKFRSWINIQDPQHCKNCFEGISKWQIIKKNGTGCLCLPEDMTQLDDLLGDGEGGLLVEPLEAAVPQDAPLHLQMLFFNAFFSPGFWQGCGFRIHLIRIRIRILG
jgi:hypothetical protein